MSAFEVRRLTREPPQDECERRELYEAARALYISLERPIDAMHRLFWSVEQLPLLQIGIDLGVFRAMSQESANHWTIEELSQTTKADVTLLFRILRYYVSFGLIRVNPDSTYSATETTKWLSTPGAEGGVVHYMRTIAPVLQALPAVLKTQGYRNPTNSADTAFQEAWKTDKPAYSWVPPDPKLGSAFMAFMKSQREGQKQWTDAFPIELLKINETDLSSGRARVDKAELANYGIDAQVHDFFSEQPVKHARAYYLRNIMHDWPDDKCLEILQRLREACVDDSMVLIDEMVLPDTGVSWKQAQKDIQMMAALAAMERSRSQWEDLLTNAGLKIDRLCTYDDEMGDSVIIATKA